MTSIVFQQSDIEKQVLEALTASRGHFLFESGHHGDLWLDLDVLFVDARRMSGWAAKLGMMASACQPQVVCGPLTGGAFVAQAVAVELGAGFVFAEQSRSKSGSACYRIPKALRNEVRGKRVLLVDDVVNAGSALLATLSELVDSGGTLIGIACLVMRGEAAASIAKRNQVPLVALASLQSNIWNPRDCPLCASGVPLVDRLTRT